MSPAFLCLSGCTRSDSAVFLPRSMMPVPFHHFLTFVTLFSFCPLMSVSCMHQVHVLWHACCLAKFVPYMMKLLSYQNHHSPPTSLCPELGYIWMVYFLGFYEISLCFTIHLILNDPFQSKTHSKIADILVRTLIFFIKIVYHITSMNLIILPCLFLILWNPTPRRVEQRIVGGSLIELLLVCSSETGSMIWVSEASYRLVNEAVIITFHIHL